VEIVEFVMRYRWALVGVALAVIVLAFLAFRPDKLFVDDVVDEGLAEAFAAPVSEQTAPDAGATDTSTAPLTTVSDEPADDALAPTTTTLPPPPTTTAAGTTTTSSSTATTTTEAPEPVAVSSGEFFGINHSAEGTATIYEQDGRHVLRFEDNTDIQNGPDLYVWVLADAEYEGGNPTEYIDLGKIKGNVGGQNYELPAEFDPEIHQSVLVWCLRFSTPFAAAPLA
jgi:hypothetical protein